MAEKHITKCKVCGAEYEVCISCEKARSWRALTDTADHYSILMTLMDFQSGGDSRKAYKALRKVGVDFTELDGYIPSVRDLLAEIYRNEKGKASKAKTKSVESENDDLTIVPGNVIAGDVVENTVADVETATYTSALGEETESTKKLIL